ncbi:MAG TPA: AarF/UbiB family protein [Thermoanaerobaculia bacterium]|nr:AarF/UbiB family protein [Thermoanaerobaculia bacterium]
MRSLASNLRRLARISRILAAHLVSLGLGGRLARWPWLARRLPPGDLPGPQRLSALLEQLGGTFIKFGQMLSLQPDILSLEYCASLSNLLDRVAPCDFAAIEQVFVEDHGRSPGEMFDSFDPVPIATASIGQVHVACLDGRKWAVKVQRPTVKTDFAGDIRLMASAVRAIRFLHLKPLYWLIEPLSEFLGWTREELDYRKEARYMEQLHLNARENSTERVPEVFWAYTTRRILVLEFLDGLTLLDYLRARDAADEITLRRLELGGFAPQSFARNIIDNFLGDAFRHGMFHADLHPANLMVLPENVVGYVDFGITGVLSHYSRRHLVGLTLAYTRADLEGMCAAFFKVSEMDRNSDPEGFRAGLDRMADSWYELKGREHRLRKNFTLVMLDMLRLSRATGIWPERDVIKYIRSSIAIDGLITRFAPGFEIGRYLAEVCDRYLRLESWNMLFSYDRVVEWSAATGDLARDGGSRAASLLGRIARGELPLRPASAGDAPVAAAVAAARAFNLATVAAGAAVLMAATGERAALGANLFTAELVVIAAALMLSLKTLRGSG